jgi:hypothetical protein
MISAKEKSEEEYRRQKGEEKTGTPYNFREYEVDQNFFVVIERKKFIASGLAFKANIVQNENC